jgi:hypothetical protein
MVKILTIFINLTIYISNKKLIVFIKKHDFQSSMKHYFTHVKNMGLMICIKIMEYGIKNIGFDIMIFICLY